MKEVDINELYLDDETAAILSSCLPGINALNFGQGQYTISGIASLVFGLMEQSISVKLLCYCSIKNNNEDALI